MSIPTRAGLFSELADPVVAAFRRRDMTMATASAETLVARLPDEGTAWFLAARCWVAAGLPYKAFDALARAAELLPDCYQVQYRLGAMGLLEGCYASAHSALLRALHLRPENRTAEGMCGIAMFRSGALEPALKHLENARSEGPLGLRFGVFAAFCSIALGVQRSKVEKLLENAVAREPDWMEAKAWLAHHLQGKSRERAALALFKEIAAHQPSKWANYRIAQIGFLTRLRKGRSDGATALRPIESLGNAYVRSPDIVLPPLIAPSTVQWALIDLFEEFKTYDRQFAYLTRLHAEDTSDAKVLLRLGQCQLAMDDPEAALATFMKVYQASPENTQALSYIARCYRQIGRLEEALDHLSAHIRANPRDMDTLLTVAELELELGRTAAAEAHIIKAARIENDSVALAATSNQFMAVTGRDPLAQMAADINCDFDPGRIHIPEAFRLRIDECTVQRPRLRDALAIHGRVVSALLFRESLTRFGNERLGYLWAILEPVASIMVLYIIFLAAERRVPEGMTILSFLVTGIVAFRIFTVCNSRIQSAIQQNRSLLHFRQVTPYSLLVSRLLFTFLSQLGVFIFLVAMLPLLEDGIRLDRPLLVLFALVALAIIGGAYGTVIAIGKEFIPVLENLARAVSRVFFFTSGVFFYARELPATLRDILWWNPIFHCIELLRDGFFTGFHTDFGSIGYVLAWLVSGIFAALALERFGRSRLLENG